MSAISECAALIAALPGIVWSADREGRTVTVAGDSLRLAGLGQGALLDHRWLEIVDRGDLVGGTLLWQPVSAASVVPRATFRVTPPGSNPVALRALLVPSLDPGAPSSGWIGTLLLDRGASTDHEHVAVALLSRIAALGGVAGPPAATIGPLTGDGSLRVRSDARLVLFVACDAPGACDLTALFDILGWRTVATHAVTPVLAGAADVIVVSDPASLPPRGDGDAPWRIVLLTRDGVPPLPASDARCQWISLAMPLDVAEAEELIVALTGCK